MKSDKKPNSKIVPLRLPDDMAARISAAAKAIGETEATIIRLCIRAGLHEMEDRKYELLPISKQQMMGESVRYSSYNPSCPYRQAQRN